MWFYKRGITRAPVVVEVFSILIGGGLTNPHRTYTHTHEQKKTPGEYEVEYINVSILNVILHWSSENYYHWEK